MANLRLTGLEKRYGAVSALRPTSLDIHQGEFLTLLGPSGSGKTTLLMIVAGLLAPSGGDVWIGETRVTYQPSHRRDIGMVFQSYALFPHMTVAQNIGFPLRMRGVGAADIERRANDLLELVALAHTAARFPWELSGGQQQRIALARSLVYDPSILLMDEPLGALDKRLRDRMQLEIKRIHERTGVTILYVTHDQEEALVLSDRICVMHEGAIEQIGTPSELYESPASAFVADFLGESNILRAIALGSGLEGAARLADGTLIQGRRPQPLTDGQDVRVIFRPERLERNASVAGTNPADVRNTLRGPVEKRVYLGRYTRTWLLTATGESITWEHPSAGDSAPAVGEEVELTWSASDSLILPASQSLANHHD